MCMRDEMLPWLILIFCYILQAGSIPCDDDANIAFSGGYLSVDWQRTEPNSTSFRKITLDFKPTYEVGVLFFIELHLNGASANDSSLVSMLSYNGSLIFSIQSKEQPTQDSVISNSISLSSNNKLSLHIRHNILRIRANKWHTFLLESDVSVKNLLFGGAKDFTAYDQFPVRNYFVGTLTNFNIKQDCISVVERNELTGGQAVVQDNCTRAVPSFIEFNALSLPLASVTIQPTTHLRVNFTIAAKQCVGEILHLNGGSFMLGLSASKLITTITNSSGHSAVCISNDVIDQSRWINVMITYINDTVKYFVDDREGGSCHIDLGTVNFTGTVIVGDSKNASVSFIGHLRHLYWDNSEINLVGLVATEQQSCVGIGPVSCDSDGFNTTFSPSCPTCTLRDLPIHWATFDVSVRSNLTVNENRRRTIRSDNFMLSYAGSQCLTDTSLQKLRRDINFTLKKPPADGKLDRVSFTFENLYKNEVHYNHLGAEEESDVISLLIQVHCGTKLLYMKYVKMYIHVSPINDYPQLHLSPVSMVIGTRKVITKNVIEMSDSDTPLQLVRCVESKVGQNGTPTGQFEWANNPDHRITEPFNQHDINAGRIVLRLFLNATGTSKVALTVSDGSVENFGNFEVHGSSDGKIMLMTNKLEAVENRSVSIDGFHLVAGTNFVTNFGYQNSPVVSFILTSFPKYGELLLVHNQSFVERNVSHFTQYHIDNRMLFYSHIVHVQNSTKDCFSFTLMVDDFEGDSYTFCVDILIEDHLPKLVLNVSMPQNITLFEGDEKLITNDDLVITAGLKLLNGQINTSLPDDIIILLLFIEPPKYGCLYLNNSNDTKRVFSGSNISLTQLTAGLLVYDHKVEEEHQDSFRVKIIAQNFSHLPIHSLPVISSMEYVVFVDITAINNKYPHIQIYDSINVTEGSYVYLTTDIINITDADRPAENLTGYVAPKVAFNGHFATRDNYSVAISRFSVNQIITGEVIFKHYLGNKLEEDYILVVSDGLHNSSNEIKVIAKPVILDVVTIHSIEQCSLHLDLQKHNSVQIHDRLFSISLNSGNLPNVRVTTTMDNCLYFNNSIDISPVTNFSKRDIDQGRIWYVVKDNTTRVSTQQFGLNFSIGHAEPVHVQFQVCLSLLPYPQLDNAASNLNLLLPEGGDIEINSSVLSSTDTRNQTSLYDVCYELLVPPTYGQLMMRLEGMQLEAAPVMKFYQQDVDDGNIYYDNHNYSSHGDILTLTLSNQFYNRTANVTISITISLLKLKVVNNGFKTREGSNHTILSNELYATGPQGYSIMFYIDTPPVHGIITFNTDHSKVVSSFSKDQLDDRLVAYINDDEEFYHDSMKIRIEAIGSVDTPSHINDTTYFGTVHITIELVNDNKPRSWNVTKDVHVVDGDSFIITSYILSYQDDDADMDINLLEYTVDEMNGPSYGYFFGSNKTVVTHFLQRDIFDLQIGYQSNKSFVANNEDSHLFEYCVLTVSDGLHSTQFFFTLNIVPFTVEFVKNESLLVDEGGRMALSDKNLLLVAARAKPPANDSEYIYKITRQPMHGQLVMPNSCNCTFTQEELRNGSVIYNHDDSNTTKDSFTFVVTVRGFKTTVMSFVISIDPVDDESPSITYVDRFIVRFDETVFFNKSVIEAMDSEAGLSDLKFNVVTAPKFGRIKYQRGPRNITLDKSSSFTQLQVNEEDIFYKHEREVDGEWIDNVTLSLSDGRNIYSKLIVITFVLIPRDLPIQVNGITLLEGRIVPLTTQNFEVTHPYLSTLELYINVTEPVAYGDLLTLYQPSTVYFNSTELENGTILYYNGEDYEVAEDTFKFVAMAGGVSSVQQTFVFTIESENDETPVIVNNLMISLWAGEVKPISRDKLFANDSDAHPADKLEYIIGTNTLLGHFALKGADHTPITKFSQDDIVTGNVVFRSIPIINDTMEIEINFTVTDGKYNVDSYITLEIDILTVTVSPQHIEVAMGADQIVSFSPHTNDGRVKRGFYYRVLTLPMFGLLMNTVSGLEVTNFTQEQINNQQIVYKHTALDQYETNDTVNFIVSTDLSEPVNVSLNVSIILKSSSTSYLAASGPLNVDEGGTVCLNDSILDAGNVLYRVWKNGNQSVALHELTIQYIIISHPSAGTLKSGNVAIDEYFEHSDMKSSTGVCYHHNGSETTSDYFSVKISISYNSTDVWYSNSTKVSIPIYIRPLNDENPEVKFVNKMCVFKSYNYTAIIRPKELYIYDKDTSDEELVIVISNQSAVVCSVTDIPTRNLTQNDINKRRVKCMLPPLVDSSNLTFYFTDGNFTSVNYTVYYKKVILTLSVTHNTSELVYRQDEGQVILTNEQLNSSTTCYRDDTIYTVIDPPIHGNVSKFNHTGAVNSFTQLDIDNGKIQYVATNMDSYNDTFTMQVTNKHATPQEVTMRVTALAMIEDINMTLTLSSVNDSQPLPAKLFGITTSVNLTDSVFTVIDTLYGHLDLLSKKRSSQQFSFLSSHLIEGRVLYVLDENITNGTEVLQLSVQPDNMQAGFAEVFFNISVLPTTTVTPVVSPTTQPVESNRPSRYHRGSGFTMVALVPIIGVPSFILMVVIILVGFWYSQKLKEKKRCAAVRGSSAICMGTSPFNLPTAHNTMATTDIDRNSEKSSYHSSNNSDEGISMALPPEDQVEDEGVAQRYVEDRFQSRPVMDYTQYHHHHPLTSVYTASGYGTPIPQHVHKLPILKNEEYWL